MRTGAGALARVLIGLRFVVNCPMRLCMPIAVVGLCLLVAAQQNGPTVSPEQALQEWRDSKAATLRDDFGELARYRDANAGLAPPGPKENRVVFLGDSITDYWKLADYFPGKPYINRGIDGQTTPQMVVRFRQDVIDLQPKVLVVLAGTNDIAGVTGPARNEDIEANYASIAELARMHQIRAVFASVLPAHNYTKEAKESFALRPRGKILALNAWLKDYCARNGLIYLDYFSALIDAQGMLRRDLSDDGLHPNAAGYKMMAPLADEAIANALANKPDQKKSGQENEKR
jgi:lysophospholipase L1-like esterase